MRYYDLISRASRSLKSAKLRTLLTSLAIGVGGFTLALTLAASNGARNYADKLISNNFDPQELLVAKDPQLFGTGGGSTGPQEYDETVTRVGGGQSFQVKRLTDDDITTLRANPDIEQVREGYRPSLQYITRVDEKKYTASGEAYNPAQKPELKSGALPASGDLIKGTILIPDDYLEKLGYTEGSAALGTKVSISVRKPFNAASASAITQQALAQIQAGVDPSQVAVAATAAPNFETKVYNFVVQGVTKKSATSLNFSTPPVLLSADDAREISDYTTEGTPDFRKFLYVNARVKNGKDQKTLDRVQAELKASGLNVSSVKDTQKTITQFINTLQIIVSVFGVITLIASVFGIVNTQYISVLERTREIGLMKALGMRRRDISRLFLLEATWIGFLGGTLGVLLALGLGIGLNPKISDLIGFDKGTYLLIFKPIQLLALVIALMLIAMLAGYLPARKAAKLNPIEALRTE